MVVDQRWRILTLKPSKSNLDQHAPLSSQLPAAYPISLPKNYCGCQTGNERSESVEKPVCFLGKTGNYFNLWDVMKCSRKTKRRTSPAEIGLENEVSGSKDSKHRFWFNSRVGKKKP